jgi:predicted DNA-binding transcriptional regulator AlpA
VETTLKEMQQQNDFINFSTVAKKAKVSQAWLYRQPPIRQQIETLRLQVPTKRSIPHPVIAIKDNIIKQMKQRIKKLEAINTELKKQLEIVYGQLHQLK